ncbi:hypothetical protein OAR30_00655 [Euryarchaeota archaeon]|jgi:hypothetical protein|nr:hypothetical protein [Euryarchaeota archaeon]MDC0851493.1 hypothetical protein [Euryarchaeota archaeon]MDC0963065.1 hypothetical protein [Euryarchaeota archaeon]MDC1029087.1 hypothetical protein [Euryarchaeota archaeon]|tara:strand:+ start:612 stop:785 length:174 start_codon:yes stop_codon:yes gene_type:complete
MLPQLKIFLDIIDASGDDFGIPIKGIISKIKRTLLAAFILTIISGIGLGYLIFVVIL